jgi:DNA-binding transcriptional MerR regulator
MPATQHHRIGEAAKRSGVSSANIRYYEREGLLSPGGRSDNQYRFYSEADLHRLRFIRLCRAMDMSLDEVRALLAIDANAEAGDHQACATLDAHLEHVQLRLQELRALELELQTLRGRCNGADAHCHVIEALHARADAQDVALQRNAPAHRHV